MNKEYGYYIPEEIILCEKDSYTFTGKKSNITYINESGNIVKDKELSKKRTTIKNDEISEFIINKSGERKHNEYFAYQGVVLYDEKRDFEFEISSTNFLNLCMFGNLNKGSLSVKCVFAFGNNGYPILLPVESTQFSKAKSFTEKRNTVFDGKLIVGHTYSLKKSKNRLFYIGNFKTDLNISYSNTNKIKKEGFYCLTESGETVYTNNKPSNKDIFYNLDKNNYYGEEFLSVSKSSICDDLGNENINLLDSVINQYKENNTFFGLSKLKVEKFNKEKDKNKPKLLHLYHDKDSGQDLFYTLDSDYCSSYSFTGWAKNNHRSHESYILKDKNNLYPLGVEIYLEKISEGVLKFLKEKIYSVNEKNQFILSEVLKQLGYNEYRMPDTKDIDYKKIFESLTGEEVIEMKIILEGAHGNSDIISLSKMYINEHKTSNILSNSYASNLYHFFNKNV